MTVHSKQFTVEHTPVNYHPADNQLWETLIGLDKCLAVSGISYVGCWSAAVNVAGGGVTRQLLKAIGGPTFTKTGTTFGLLTGGSIAGGSIMGLSVQLNVSSVLGTTNTVILRVYNNTSSAYEVSFSPSIAGNQGVSGTRYRSIDTFNSLGKLALEIEISGTGVGTLSVNSIIGTVYILQSTIPEL